MSPDSNASDPVGSLAEEAAKLVRVLASGGEQRSGSESAQGGRPHDPSNCAYCPICQVIGFVRETSPETRQHLSASLTSLTAAARGLADAFAAHAQPPGTPRDAGVQNIDLSDDETWSGEGTRGDDGWD